MSSQLELQLQRYEASRAHLAELHRTVDDLQSQLVGLLRARQRAERMRRTTAVLQRMTTGGGGFAVDVGAECAELERVVEHDIAIQRRMVCMCLCTHGMHRVHTPQIHTLRVRIDQALGDPPFDDGAERERQRRLIVELQQQHNAAQHVRRRVLVVPVATYGEHCCYVRFHHDEPYEPTGWCTHVPPRSVLQRSPQDTTIASGGGV